MLDISTHPCFNAKACHDHTRVHVPVAPRCNVQCNFCSRNYDCANESRPGVSSVLLSPQQALAYVLKLAAQGRKPSVVGIAGPGDPFANADETMQTLRLVRAEFPDTLLCVATNGLELLPWITELADLQVSHVSITVNAVDPETGSRIYAWIRDGKKIHRTPEGAALLWERQAAGIQALKHNTIVVKINTIVVPGINDDKVGSIAKTVAALGATIMNCIPLYPVAGAVFESIPEPGNEEMKRIRNEAASYLPLMQHCTRCRADAAGLLGEAMSKDTFSLLRACSELPLDGSEKRNYVAVASREGALVNQHLGHAQRFWIFKKTSSGFEFMEHRIAPDAGGGDERWRKIAALLSDCRALMVENAGSRPHTILEKSGLRIMTMSGLIEDGLAPAFSGAALPAHLAGGGCHSCKSACKCSGDGSGC